MYKVGKDGLVHTLGGELQARHVTNIATGIGEDTQSDMVLFRVWNNEKNPSHKLLPAEEVFQFTLTRRNAEVLGRELLELAAQVEKDEGTESH